MSLVGSLRGFVWSGGSSRIIVLGCMLRGSNRCNCSVVYLLHNGFSRTLLFILISLVGLHYSFYCFAGLGRGPPTCLFSFGPVGLSHVRLLVQVIVIVALSGVLLYRRIAVAFLSRVANSQE